MKRDQVKACIEQITRILRNPLYIGTHVWNRTHQTINPMTGKRIKFTNHPEKWVQLDLPELRIVTDQMWSRAQDRLDGTRRKLVPPQANGKQIEITNLSS